MSHTPGPWEIGEDYGDGSPVVTFEARDIARVEDSFGDGDTNARLIAAAPDLLEACKDLVQAHDVGMGKTAVQLRIDWARAAIAKATG